VFLCIEPVHACVLWIRPFWAGADAVVIEADAFKESDVIYRALSARGHVDMIKTAEFVRFFVSL